MVTGSAGTAGAGSGAGGLGRPMPAASSAVLTGGSPSPSPGWAQLVAWIEHDLAAVLDADEALRADHPARLDPDDLPPAQPDQVDHVGAVVELGLQRRRATAWSERNRSKRPGDAGA